jgi:hypothetical protein
MLIIIEWYHSIIFYRFLDCIDVSF